MSNLARAMSRIKAWRENVPLFAKECFGVDLDEWQIKGANAFSSPDPAHQRISFQACAGPGKSALEAILGWNFLGCYGERGEHPKGAVTAITGDNLKDNLWAEFNKWQGINAQSSYPYLAQAFTWTKGRIFANDHPETWFLSARTWAKTADAQEQGRTLSGIHSKYVAFFLDESGDIPVAVAKAGEQALSNCRFGKLVQAGNPTSRDGILFAAATHLAHLWHVIRITGDPDDPARSPRIGLEWAREQIKTYGRTDPWVMGLILGEFPESSINSLLSPDDVDKAMNRHYALEAYQFSQKRLGVDVAFQGDDRTVLFPRQGLVAFKPVVMRTQDPADIAARILAAKKKWGQEVELVDDTGGYGRGVISYLTGIGQSPIGIQFAGRAIDPGYANKRAEMWFEMAKWVKGGGQLPNDPELRRELTTPTYSLVGGKILIEPKARIKERLGQSPDKGDGLALTFGLPDMPGEVRVPGIPSETGKLLSDYDPFDPSRL